MMTPHTGTTGDTTSKADWTILLAKTWKRRDPFLAAFDEARKIIDQQDAGGPAPARYPQRFIVDVTHWTARDRKSVV
jgi:hypothetical protein